MVVEGDARRGIGGSHGAVDRETRRVPHLLEKLRLDRLAAGGEHQLQLGAGLDVGAHRPCSALDRVDRRQTHGKRESVEVEVRVVEAGEPVPEHAEGETAPALGVDGAVEEGLPLAGFTVEGDRQRAVERGACEGAFDGNEALVGDEGNRGAVRPRGVALDHRGVLLAEEALGGQRDAPTGREIEQRTARTRGDRAASLRQRVDAHAGGVLALRGVLVPTALAEGEEDGGVGDAVAVVADGDTDGGGGLVLLDGLGDDGDAGGAAAPRVLDELGERLGEPGIEEAGDAVDGAVVDGGPGSWRGHSCRADGKDRSWRWSPMKAVDGKAPRRTDPRAADPRTADPRAADPRAADRRGAGKERGGYERRRKAGISSPSPLSQTVS